MFPQVHKAILADAVNFFASLPNVKGEHILSLVIFVQRRFQCAPS